jgi:hypothetical protein
MGRILDPEEVGGKHLALEIRRESLVIMDINRKYPGEYPNETIPDHGRSEHIFAYQDGEIEISKEALLELVKFLDDPGNRKMVFGSYADLGKETFNLPT